MSYDAKNRVQSPPKAWGEPAEWTRKVAHAVRGALDGKLNNHFEVTLEAGSTTTDVTFIPATTNSVVLVMPANAAAATLARTTNVWATSTIEKVTVNHDASADGTEIFSLAVFG